MTDPGSDALFKISDVILVVATFAGGMAAVGIQRLLEQRGDKKKRQRKLFEDLMATRATRLAPLHVESLNAIPLVFYGRGKKLKQIRDDWNDYLRHLSDKTKREKNLDAWSGEQIPKLVAILYEISQYLGFSFSKEEIENGIYAPEGHQIIENDRLRVLWGFARVFEGKLAFPVWINNLQTPVDQKTPPKPEVGD